MALVLIHVQPGECICAGPYITGGVYNWVCDKDRDGVIWIEVPEGGDEVVVIGNSFVGRPGGGEEPGEPREEPERPRIVPPFSLPTFHSAVGGQPLVLHDLTLDRPVAEGQKISVKNGRSDAAPGLVFKDRSQLPSDARVDVNELPDFNGRLVAGEYFRFDDSRKAAQQRMLEFFNRVSEPGEMVARVRDNVDTGVLSPLRYGIRLDTASRILQARQALPGQKFERPEQIDQVAGVGADTWQDILFSFQQVPSGKPPSAQSPGLRDVHQEGLDTLLDLYSRSLGVCPLLAAQAVEPLDLSAITAAQRNSVRTLLHLKDLPAGEFDARVAVEAIGADFLKVWDALTPLLAGELIAAYSTVPAMPVAFRGFSATPVFVNGFASDLLLFGMSPVMSIQLASLDPTMPIPVDQLIPLLVALLEELQEAANVVTQGPAALRLAALIAQLRMIIATLQAMVGQRMSLTALANLLKPILQEIMLLLRSSLTAGRFRMVLQAVLRFATGLADLATVGGGAAAAGGGGGAAGGAAAGGAAGGAAASTLWVVLAILLALGLGMLIGYLLGKIKIGDQTIHEWLGDFFYWLIWAPASGCDETYTEYVRWRSLRRQAEASEQNEVAVALVIQEIAALRRYIALECEDNMSIYRRELNRLEARLDRLVGG